MLNLVLENNKYLEFKDCLYVPKFRKNSISISSLNRLDYSVYFNKKNDSFICSCMLVNTFFVSLLLFLLSIVENNHVLLKRKVPSTDQTYHGIYA